MKRLTRRALLSQVFLCTLGLSQACRPAAQAPIPPQPATAGLTPSRISEPTAIPTPSAADSATSAPAMPLTVTIDAIDNCFTRFAQQQAAEFAVIRPGIRLAWRSVTPWTAYPQVVAERAAAGELDIIQAPLGLMMQAWAHFGYIRPLNALLAPLEQSLGDIFPGAVAASSYNGQVMGVPFVADPGESLLLYNHTLFAAMGQPIPTSVWTADDLTTAASQMNQLDGLGHLTQYGYIPRYTLPGQLAVLRAFGGELFTSDTNEIQVETLLPMLRWYGEQLHTSRVFPCPYELAASPLTLLLGGQAAMLRGSFGTLAGNSTQNSWLEAAPFPAPAHRPHGGYLNGLAHCLAASSPSPAASIAWCAYIASAAVGVRMLQQGCHVPGCRLSSWQAPAVGRAYPTSAQCGELANQAQPEPVPHNLRQSEIYRAWQNEGEPFWRGSISPEEFAERFAAAGRRILSSPILAPQTLF